MTGRRSLVTAAVVSAVYVAVIAMLEMVQCMKPNTTCASTITGAAIVLTALFVGVLFTVGAAAYSIAGKTHYLGKNLGVKRTLIAFVTILALGVIVPVIAVWALGDESVLSKFSLLREFIIAGCLSAVVLVLSLKMARVGEETPAE